MPGADLGAFATACAAAAAVLHLAAAPARADEASWLGAAFVAAAAVQCWCAWQARRSAPGRAWQPVVVVEAVVVGAWLASWTAGIPGGAHDGAEPVHLAAAVTCALEALVLLTAVVASLAPEAVARARAADARATARATAVLVAAATVAALLGDASLRSGEAERGADAGAANVVVTTTVARPRTAGLEDMPGATLLLPGETAPATTAAATAVSPTTSTATASPTTTTAAAGSADRGFAALGAGRRTFDEVAVDAATRASLAAQLAGTAALVTAYPTVAAAEAAGYRRAGPFSPGVGTPYAPPRAAGNLDGRIDTADVADAVLLFDGTAPASRLAGFEYLATRARTDTEPEGFAGPNDHWSYATDVCRVVDDRGVARTPLGIDRSVTRSVCDALGGTLVPFAWWYVRVWTVPAYGVAEGIFRDLNPAITCADGTYHVRPVEQLGTGDSLCR